MTPMLTRHSPHKKNIYLIKIVVIKMDKPADNYAFVNT